MDEWDYLDDEGEVHGREVYVTEQETHSQLLGPDGEPLQYEQQPFGFDLRPRNTRTQQAG